MITEIESIVSNEQVNEAFKGTNFGSLSNRDVIKYSLLKYASLYSTGHTAKCILIELGLISATTRKLTRQGKRYLYEAFCDNISM